MNFQPSLKLSLRDIAVLARTDPVATYEIFCELTQVMTAPSADPYAKAAATLAVGIMRAREEYAQRADAIAEEIAEEERSPELPFERVA